MEKNDATGHFYDSARTELIERIGHRDNALILYLGAAGAIFGVAYGTEKQPLIVLLLVPFLALGASFIVAQHHAVIGALGRYLGRELESHLRKGGGTSPPQWDTSESLSKYFKMAMAHRLWSHLLLLFFPSVMSIGLNWRLLCEPVEKKCLWLFATVCTLLVLWPVISSHIWRNKLRADTLWHDGQRKSNTPA